MIHQWENKKAENAWWKKDAKKQAELTPQERQLQQFQEQAADIREGNEKSGIYNKLMSGQDLTAAELEYLRKNDPQNYNKYRMGKLEQKAYEERLKRCKIKDEARRVHINRLNGHLSGMKSVANNANIPDGAKLAMIQQIQGETIATSRIFRAFVESGEFGSLPSEAEVQQAEQAKAEQERTELIKAPENFAQTEPKPDVIGAEGMPEVDEAVQSPEKSPEADSELVPIEAEETVSVESIEEPDTLTQSEKQILDEMKKIRKKVFRASSLYSQVDFQV